MASRKDAAGLRSAIRRMAEQSSAQSGPSAGGATSGNVNVASAVNVGRQPGSTTGAFSIQSGGVTRQGVLRDDGWHVTERQQGSTPTSNEDTTETPHANDDE